MFPKLLFFLSTHEMKKSSHLFCKNSNCSKCFMKIEETYIFSSLIVGKKVFSFWGIDFESLTNY